MTSNSCGICLADIKQPVATGSCAHQFCQDCLLKWCESQMGRCNNDAIPTCPSCRSPIVCISGVGQATATQDTNETNYEMRHVRVAHPSGITITRQGAALVVEAVSATCGAEKAGIQPGDTICAIDGRITFSHSVAILLIEQLGRLSGSVVLCISNARQHANDEVATQDGYSLSTLMRLFRASPASILPSTTAVAAS